MFRPRPLGTVGVLLLLTAACASASAPGADQESATERTIFADVNIAISDVPLDEIVFDTFDGGQVALPDASEDVVASLLNAIRPLDDPNYVPASAATYLSPDDLVLGYVADDGSAWAHPHRGLNFHEIINTLLADRPVVVTYWNLTGTELLSLPSTTTTWATWLATHPDSMVLGDDQGQGPAYAFDPFVDYSTRVEEGNFRFPLSADAQADDRLSLATRVIGFEVDGGHVAVPVLVNQPTAIVVSANDPLVLFLDGAGGGSVYRSSAVFTADAYGFVDADGAVWVSLTDGDTRLLGPAGEIE